MCVIFFFSLWEESSNYLSVLCPTSPTDMAADSAVAVGWVCVVYFVAIVPTGF